MDLMNMPELIDENINTQSKIEEKEENDDIES